MQHINKEELFLSDVNEALTTHTYNYILKITFLKMNLYKIDQLIYKETM